MVVIHKDHVVAAFSVTILVGRVYFYSIFFFLLNLKAADLRKALNQNNKNVQKRSDSNKVSL